VSYHYFSIQYSAIQKTVLRHDRLWSIAGISNILSRLNEVEMPRIARDHGGEAIVAGGGKFTARFDCEEKAIDAKNECIALISTTLPMLETQTSNGIKEGTSFQSLSVNSTDRNPILTDLSEQKRQFRGYAVTYNPHLELCSECGEYPQQEFIRRGEKTTRVCRICAAAFEESRKIHKESEAHTTLQKIYHGYLGKVPGAIGKKTAADFKDLFPGDSDERKRMAVWFSDINNMNDKVPVWLKQADEDNVLNTFKQFRTTIVDIVVTALAKTFPQPAGKFFPFRLVVAGGDDLCLVMSEKNILSFARNISFALNKVKDSLDNDHPLSDDWLKQHGYSGAEKPKPFGFGGSFVVTSIHTPFSQIHQLGEELMGDAKQKTDRQGNSVNWRIMAEADATTDQLLEFEKPLFIEKKDGGKNSLGRLTLADYADLLTNYKGKPSGSHLQQVVGIMQQEKNPWELERQLKLLDATEVDKSFSFLLHDPAFRNPGEMLLPQRIATFLELKTISGGFGNE